MDERKVFSLAEVTRSIQMTLLGRYGSSFWVKAELNKLNHYRHSGHCYPELVEKKGGRLIAQMRSTLWKEDYEEINGQFLRVLKEPLKDGIKILFLARISFDPIYGLALRILDIDPSYTLGDLEREKQSCIDRLIKEGIFSANKSLSLPLLPQRIALISVETSKGYADFTRILSENPWGYAFFWHLFPALLQGDKAVASILTQLSKIKRVSHHFDAVAIIRGGGDDAGLSCYNHYDLASGVALFPLPVLTGIGHATNETVVEMVAHGNEITPSKLAESFIQAFHNVSASLDEYSQIILNKSRELSRGSKQDFFHLLELFRSRVRHLGEKHRRQLKNYTQALSVQTRFIGEKQRDYVLKQFQSAIGRQSALSIQQMHREVKQLSKSLIRASHSLLKSNHSDIASMESSRAQLHPDNVLKRGYSITRFDHKAIRESHLIHEGDLIETTLLHGKLISVVRESRKERRQ